MGKIQDAAGRFMKRSSVSPLGLLPGLESAVRAARDAEEAAARGAVAREADRPAPQVVPLLSAAPTRYSLVMLRALQGKTVYQGTVPAHVKARRRAKNKAARKTRRLSRQRAQ